MTVDPLAVEFLQGWVSGYLAAGGTLSDDGLGEKAAKAYKRRLNPPDLPEPVSVRLEDAIAIAAALGEFQQQQEDR